VFSQSEYAAHLIETFGVQDISFDPQRHLKDSYGPLCFCQGRVGQPEFRIGRGIFRVLINSLVEGLSASAGLPCIQIRNTQLIGTGLTFAGFRKSADWELAEQRWPTRLFSW